MNETTMICLISDEVQGIKCSYELDHNDKPERLYTFKSLDRTIKPMDLVVVPTNTRHEFTVVRVEEINVEIPLEDTIQYNWIAGIFDRRHYDEVLAEEEIVINKVKSGQKTAKRRELRGHLEEALDNKLPQLTSGLTIDNDSSGDDVDPPKTPAEKA